MKLTHRRFLFVLGALAQIRNHPHAGGDGVSDNSGKKMHFGSAKQKVGTITIVGVCAKKCATKRQLSHRGTAFVLGAPDQFRRHPHDGVDVANHVIL